MKHVAALWTGGSNHELTRENGSFMHFVIQRSRADFCLVLAGVPLIANVFRSLGYETNIS